MEKNENRNFSKIHQNIFVAFLFVLVMTLVILFECGFIKDIDKSSIYGTYNFIGRPGEWISIPDRENNYFAGHTINAEKSYVNDFGTYTWIGTNELMLEGGYLGKVHLLFEEGKGIIQIITPADTLIAEKHSDLIFFLVGSVILPGDINIYIDGQVDSDAGLYDVFVFGNIAGKYPEGVTRLTSENFTNQAVGVSIASKNSEYSEGMDASSLEYIDITVESGVITAYEIRGRAKVVGEELDYYTIIGP